MREPEPAIRPQTVPAELLALQHAAGNHAVSRLMRGAQPTGGRVLRTVSEIYRFRPRPITSQAALNQKVRTYWDRYNQIDRGAFPDYELVRPELTDAAVVQHTQGFLADNTPRQIKDVAEEVYAKIREDVLRRRLVSEGSSVLPGVKAAVLSASAATEGLRPNTPLPAAAVDLHAPSITFRAVVGVDGRPEALAGWQVGITQTVLHVDRRFALRVDAQNQSWVMDSTTTLAAPANDRNAGSVAPWYATHSDLDSGAAIHTVTLNDKPGEEFNLSNGNVTGVIREGTDRFGTWVILWHPATRRARFLGGWTWTVDYNHEAGASTRVSSFMSRVSTGADPPEAVLDGPRCRDVLKSTKSQPRAITAAEDQGFDTAETRDRTGQAFSRASETFAKALAQSDMTVMSDERDRAIDAWRALGADQRSQRTGELLSLLDQFEQRVNHRRPSQDALRAQYALS